MSESRTPNPNTVAALERMMLEVQKGATLPHPTADVGRTGTAPFSSKRYIGWN